MSFDLEHDVSEHSQNPPAANDDMVDDLKREDADDPISVGLERKQSEPLSLVEGAHSDSLSSSS